MFSKEYCLEVGGHCWVDRGVYYRNAVVGAPSVGIEYCKHCPAQRRKTSQPGWKYEEIEDRA
jgi:hypothetical protein